MSKRNLSILDYVKQLQLEYLLYELRLKIYPTATDKDKFKSVMKFKESKILDICKKNGLNNMFNDGEILQEIEKEFYNEFGNPKDLTRKDQYFYYWRNSDFQYEGRGVKLVSYNLEMGQAKVSHANGRYTEVDINSIRRIL